MDAGVFGLGAEPGELRAWMASARSLSRMGSAYRLRHKAVAPTGRAR
ncbi:hypothetical protein [Streptomyces sp. NPDC055099]